jgi:hypothetical protein
MRIHLLATPLVSAALLLSTLGCSKKADDPAATPTTNTGTASYKLDGKTITCKVRAGGGYAYGSGHTGQDYDFISVALTTTPEPVDGRELLQLDYSRPNPGETTLYYYNKGSLTPTCEFSGMSGSAMSKSNGGISGTFTAQARSSDNTPPPYTAITDGVFDSLL